MRETGILEELRMENLSRNPNRNFSIWDTILYEKIQAEPNITALLNCSCLDAEMDSNRIVSVSGWQLTTYTRHAVKARIFADCSGDGILAPLTGADFRMGRESRDEFGESIAPEEADACTMGLTCLFQAKKHDTPQPFEPLDWAYTYESCDELPYGDRLHRWLHMGYWWVEVGGESQYNSIADTEEIRDELLKIVYGVWDHIKNRCKFRKEAENWELDWIQFLPAKRESLRYLGPHVLTEGDIVDGGVFKDLVAYGGWDMDDHHPEGFRAAKNGGAATIFHHAPSPYGIPYRSLYSRNIANLMFAGRDASCTHAAMSSTRVMGTGCSMGQAVGTAAAMAVEEGILPGGIRNHIDEIQQKLIQDDAYLPGVVQRFSEAVCQARLTALNGDPEPVRDGVNRTVGEDNHCWECGKGDWIAYEFDKPRDVSEATLILDSGLDQCVSMSWHQEDDQLTSPPGCMPKAFRLEARVGGEWKTLVAETRNHQRLRRYAVDRPVEGLRFVLEESWGSETSRVYGFYFK